ncbi:MAG: HD domain-containing phosphohydrolase [Halanaerobiaceae bacterium]
MLKRKGKYYIPLFPFTMIYFLFNGALDSSNETIKVGTYSNEPVVFRNTMGEIDGFFSDILEKIAEEKGWEIEYVHGSWGEGLQRLSNNEIDIMTGIAYTEERDRFYEFPEEGFITTWGQIYTTRGANIMSILDLDQKKVGVLSNDIYYIGEVGLRELADKFQVECEFVEYDNYDQILASIEAGEINAGMVPRLYGISQAEKYNVEDCPVVINPIDLTVATPEGSNRELLSVIDDYLEEFKGDESSFYYQRLDHWTTKYEEDEMPLYLRVGLLLIYIIFTLFIVILYIIRRQVRVKTRQLREKEKQLERDIKRRKKLERSLQKNKNKITQLHQVAIEMEKLELPEDVYQATVEAAESILDFKLCLLKIYKDNRLQTVAVSSSFYALKAFPESPAGGNGEGKMVANCFSSALTFPLENIGELQVYPGPDNAFDEEEQELTQLLLSHTLSALQRLQAEEKIRYISFHDRLTGLYNRDYLEEEMKRLDSERQLPLSIIMGDVDGLKLVNDTFGHRKGDRLLQEIAAILRESTRSEDIIGRWGGDEFLMILPRTELVEAWKIMKRIEQACLEADWILPYFISLGTGVKEEMEQNLDEIIKEADDSMYTRKVQQGSKSRKKMLKKMLKSLQNRDYAGGKHSEGVKSLSLAMAREMSLDDERKRKLELAAKYHDIGMLSVPETILLKEEELTPEEWEKIKTHPEVGYRVLKTIDEYTELAECILHHHEDWNGEGYPSGLKKKEIPLSSRIIRIADTFQAITGERVYHKKKEYRQAIRELKQEAGKSLDPELVKIFTERVLPQYES